MSELSIIPTGSQDIFCLHTPCLAKYEDCLRLKPRVAAIKGSSVRLYLPALAKGLERPKVNWDEEITFVRSICYTIHL